MILIKNQCVDRTHCTGGIFYYLKVNVKRVLRVFEYILIQSDIVIELAVLVCDCQFALITIYIDTSILSAYSAKIDHVS